MEELLPMPHHTHITIVQVDNLDGQVVLPARGQFLNAHMDTGLARHAGNSLAGVGKLDAHCRWKPEPHGAQAARIDPLPRPVEFIELSCPHLMLADVRSNKS